MNDKPTTKSRRSLLKLVAVATLVCGVAAIAACLHMSSNLPSSADGLSPSGVEALLLSQRLLVNQAVPLTSAWLIMVSVVLWCCSRE